ncbi:MAG: arsenate reductase (glutaredoxin) [Thiotrichales bacterium]
MTDNSENTTLIFHNPRCSKSRMALELLRGRGIEPTVIEYLKTPPSREELGRVLALLGMEPRALMRRKEDEYLALNLDNPDLTRDELIDAMLSHPRLIERPIVIAGGKAILGRPPERVLDLIQAPTDGHSS